MKMSDDNILMIYAIWRYPM